MSLEKTEAIVIRQTDYSETSRVVTFFSRDFGRFTLLAKGAKRLKGPFDAALDLLSACRIVFIRKSSGALGLLTEARLIQRFQPPKSPSSLSSLYSGYYVAELLNGLTEDFDPDAALYDLSLGTLSALGSPDNNPLIVIIHFEISLLQQIGLLPNLFECCVCNSPIDTQGGYAHWVSQGGVLCSACRREEYPGNSISSGSIETLRRMTELSVEKVQRIRLTAQQIQECHRTALSAITQALGRRPSTLRYLQF